MAGVPEAISWQNLSLRGVRTGMASLSFCRHLPVHPKAPFGLVHAAVIPVVGTNAEAAIGATAFGAVAEMAVPPRRSFVVVHLSSVRYPQRRRPRLRVTDRRPLR